jgi:hypothetical protein
VKYTIFFSLSLPLGEKNQLMGQDFNEVRINHVGIGTNRIVLSQSFRIYLCYPPVSTIFRLTEWQQKREEKV